MKEHITIYDIAKEAGVSASSVSRVLSGHPNVSSALRAKVLEVTDRYHYLPSMMAQHLDQGKNNTIGIVMPTVNNPYYSALFSAANEAAQEQGYSTWLHQLSTGGSLIKQDLVDQLIHRRLAGVLLTGSFSDPEIPPLRKAVAMLQNYMLVVALCTPIADLGCLCFHNDLSSAIEQAVRHLYNLGHTRIAFLGGPALSPSSTLRGKSFLDSLALCGLDYPPDYFLGGGYDANSGALAVLQMLSSLPAGRRPTALLCFNDLVAIGAIQQLHKAGLRLPDDMAVIGCDNIFFAAYTAPPLTTIDLYPEKTAQHAIQVLLRSDASASPIAQVMEATLVVRESCGIHLGRRRF